jgi:hypothetical protein
LFQENLSLVTSAATRENVFERAVSPFFWNESLELQFRLRLIMKMAVLQLLIKLFSGGLFLALVAAGCVTRSQANAQARMAYLAGQNDALAKMAAGQRTSVFIVGPVQMSEVPWTEGLTLAQAIAMANYTGLHDPKEITITRQGEQASINPKELFSGHVVPLEPGDTITIRE